MPRLSSSARALILAVLTFVVAAPVIAAGVHGSARADPAALLTVDCERLEGSEASITLAGMPAPRVILLHGSLPIVTMEPFARFLVDMGYPEEALRDPADGSFTRGSFGGAAALAGMLAWYYERDGMRPMLIGHSQGGMLVMRTLHQLAGGFSPQLAVVDPVSGQALARTTIVDPYTGEQRPVVGLDLSFAAAIATGKLARVLLGQWTMLDRLRKVPDSVDEFTGFAIAWDPIAGNGAEGEPYVATGTAEVRNVTLPSRYSHIGAPITEHLPGEPATRAWIVDWHPDAPMPPLPGGVDVRNLELAADLWYSVRYHWCSEGQRRLLAGGGVR